MNYAAVVGFGGRVDLANDGTILMTVGRMWKHICILRATLALFDEVGSNPNVPDTFKFAASNF